MDVNLDLAQGVEALDFLQDGLVVAVVNVLHAPLEQEQRHRDYHQLHVPDYQVLRGQRGDERGEADRDLDARDQGVADFGDLVVEQV